MLSFSFILNKITFSWLTGTVSITLYKLQSALHVHRLILILWILIICQQCRVSLPALYFTTRSHWQSDFKQIDRIGKLSTSFAGVVEAHYIVFFKEAFQRFVVCFHRNCFTLNINIEFSIDRTQFQASIFRFVQSFFQLPSGLWMHRLPVDASARDKRLVRMIMHLPKVWLPH